MMGGVVAAAEALPLIVRTLGQVRPQGQARKSPSPAALGGRLTEVALGFQRILADNPRHPRALMGISLVALASGQHQSAVQMATAAVEGAPEVCIAWVMLGQALKSNGQNEEAERAYAKAIHLDGTSPLARMGLGELKIATGRPEEAIRDYELALRRQPTLVAAHMGLGHALACLGRFEDALDRYEQALVLKPQLSEAEFASGFALARLDRPGDAEIRYRRAIAARPDFAAAWMNLGNLLRDQGRELHAEAALLRSIQLRPDLIPGWLNLALLERERRRPAAAEDYLLRALKLNPDHIEILVAWCQFCAFQARLPQAQDWLSRALAANPRHAEAVNMRGILLHNEGRYEQAVAAFSQAEALGSLAAASNRGNSLLDLGRDNEALRAHETAAERDPHAAGALYNLALTRLRLGDWERGWPQYEARWRFREVHRNPRVFRQPRWQGEELQGCLILLHAEQGLGDTIQFCRYAAMVAALGGSVILQVQAGVERLMRSLPIVKAAIAQIAVLGAKPPDFDLQCPLMSLPAVFGTVVETVPWPGAYLAADPELIEQKRAQFAPAAHCLRIGIAWAGNPRYKADSQRSMDLKTLLPLLVTPGVAWVSLQKGEPPSQLAQLPSGVAVRDGSSNDADLADTAALIATLDLVISTDTSIAHLAGAMGKPVWILLPHLADWRWMQRIETTPWYPTARLFRQREAGDWPEVLHRIATALEALQPPRGEGRMPANPLPPRSPTASAPAS
jgi:tetratricopeptide (TPR) repeat protein